MKIFKLITSVLYAIVIVFLVFIAAATAFSVLKGPGGYRFFVVQSGSMEPSIKTGSAVLVVPEKDYKQGDVITFLANPKANLKEAKATITHRIAEVKNDNNVVSYSTKGDANNASDRETVSKSSVLGKVVLAIPLVGYVVAFAKTQTGFILLVVIPGTLIIYSELITIKNEIVRLIKSHRTNKANKTNSTNTKTNKK